MRFYKGLAIINYLIMGFFMYMDIAGAILGITRGDPPPAKYYIVITSLSAVFFLIGLKNHMKYRKERKVCKEFLDGKNIEKIDYMINRYQYCRGVGYYTLEYYIGGKVFHMTATKMDCRNNKNNEYYIKPIYDRKGRVRELVPYMDKKNLIHKECSYVHDLERYKEMQRLKEENIEEKEEKPEKHKYTGIKTPLVPKTNSKRMKKKYDKK